MNKQYPLTRKTKTVLPKVTFNDNPNIDVNNIKFFEKGDFEQYKKFGLDDSQARKLYMLKNSVPRNYTPKKRVLAVVPECGDTELYGTMIRAVHNDTPYNLNLETKVIGMDIWPRPEIQTDTDVTDFGIYLQTGLTNRNDFDIELREEYGDTTKDNTWNNVIHNFKKKFDFILIDNKNISYGKSASLDIYERACRFVSENGIIMILSEYGPAWTWMEKVTPKLNELNPFFKFQHKIFSELSGKTHTDNIVTVISPKKLVSRYDESRVEIEIDFEGLDEELSKEDSESKKKAQDIDYSGLELVLTDDGRYIYINPAEDLEKNK